MWIINIYKIIMFEKIGNNARNVIFVIVGTEHIFVMICSGPGNSLRLRLGRGRFECSRAVPGAPS